jgi:hypothetical protein
MHEEFFFKYSKYLYIIIKTCTKHDIGLEILDQSPNHEKCLRLTDIVIALLVERQSILVASELIDIGLLGKRMQRHLCPRRNAVDFKLGFPPEPAVGVVDIRLAQGRDLRRNNALRAPDAFALLFIHPVPGLMRRSTTIVSESIRPSLVFLPSAHKMWSQF